MKNRAHVIISLWVLLSVVPVKAFSIYPPPQENPHPLLDTTFIKLNMNLVPTGILDDFAATPVDFSPYDGVLRDTNYVYFPTLNGLLSGLSSAVVGNQVIPSDLSQQMSSMYQGVNNPVGIVAYKYNRTKENAVGNHFIEYNNELGEYHDVYNNNEWVNPYDSLYVVAFSPYMNVSGSVVTYTFSADQRFTNLDIAYIHFHPGIGNYRDVGLNNNSFTIDYSNSNLSVAELILEIGLTDNTILRTHSKIAILASGGGSGALNPLDDTVTFQCDSCYMGYNKTVKARMTVRYASGCTITKPLIVAEGFDPFTNPVYEIGGNYNSGSLNIDDFDKKIEGNIEIHPWKELGYDIIYVDWLDSNAPIQANADILIQVIQWVNANKVGSNKNVLMGRSMGGLIARYALRKMETTMPTPLSHDVFMYVSNDAPHLGANVPVGAVYAARYLLDTFSFAESQYVKNLIHTILELKNLEEPVGNTDFLIDEVFALGSAPSVKQMLMNYVDTDYQYNSTTYTAFQSVLNTMGYPRGDVGQGIINLALSNGGVNNYVFSNTKIAQVDAGFYGGALMALIACFNVATGADSPFALILPELFLFKGLNWTMKVYANTPSTQTVYESRLYIKKFHGLFAGVQIPITSPQTVSPPPSTIIYDYDYGSYFEPDVDPYHLGNWFWGDIFADIEFNKFMFVPTVSSLAVNQVSEQDRRTDFDNLGLDMNRIPFDGYKFIIPSPTEHMSFDKNAVQWIDRMADISMAPSPDTLINGYQLFIDDAHPAKGSFTYSWSVADETVATISSSGVLTKVLGGASTAYADIEFNGGYYRLKRPFYIAEEQFPGFPSYVLTQEPDVFGNEFNGNYTITATSSVYVPTVFKQFMTCHWGVKVNDNSEIQWTTTQYIDFHHWNNFFCNFPNSATSRRVYYYVTYKNQTSPTYSVYCRLPLIPYDPLLGSFVLGDDGSLYTEGMDNPFAQVKGETGDETFTLTCVDHILQYNHWPTSVEFCTDMLDNEEFVALIKTLKPWGTDEVIMIPYSYHSNKGLEENYGYITIRYDDAL